jgi:hypothetical protein
LRAAVVLIVVACESSPVTPPPNRVIVDAAVPVDLRTRPTIPVTLTSASPWVMRQLDVGAVPFPQRATTFTLRRDNGRALLEIATQKAISKDLMNVSGWEPATTRNYLGTVTETAETVTLDLTDGAEPLHLVCKAANEKAAPANAVRKPGPRRGEACGDKGRWVPATTTTVDVLRCETGADYKRKYGDSAYLAFALTPGIEWTHLNDDCVVQGGGWRLIPADHAIAEFRGY